MVLLLTTAIPCAGVAAAGEGDVDACVTLGLGVCASVVAPGVAVLRLSAVANRLGVTLATVLLIAVATTSAGDPTARLLEGEADV